MVHNIWKCCFFFPSLHFLHVLPKQLKYAIFIVSILTALKTYTQNPKQNKKHHQPQQNNKTSPPKINQNKPRILWVHFFGQRRVLMGFRGTDDPSPAGDSITCCGWSFLRPSPSSAGSFSGRKQIEVQSHFFYHPGSPPTRAGAIQQRRRPARMALPCRWVPLPTPGGCFILVWYSSWCFFPDSISVGVGAFVSPWFYGSSPWCSGNASKTASHHLQFYSKYFSVSFPTINFCWPWICLCFQHSGQKAQGKKKDRELTDHFLISHTTGC